MGHLSQPGLKTRCGMLRLPISALSARMLFRFLYVVQIAIFHVFRYFTQIVCYPNRTLFKGPLYIF